MNHEWKIGELAVCIRSFEELGLIRDMIYMIYEIGGKSGTGLRIIGPNPHRGYQNGDGTRSTGFWKSNRFRPLDDSDKQRIAEKYKDSLPKRSFVKDDDAARKRIEELLNKVRTMPTHFEIGKWI